MSAERDPQIGDVFRWASCQGNWHTLVRTVVAVDDTFVYWRAEDKSGSVPLSRWSDRATIVPPRPKVADHWGAIFNGLFVAMSNEDNARSLATAHGYTLARIVSYTFAQLDGTAKRVAVVCDEHGVPFEVGS